MGFFFMPRARKERGHPGLCVIQPVMPVYPDSTGGTGHSSPTDNKKARQGRMRLAGLQGK